MVDAGRRSRWRSLYSKLEAGEFQRELFIVEPLFKFGIVQEVESGRGPLGFFRLDMRTLSGAFSGLTETRASGVSLSLLSSMTIGSSGLWPTVVGRVVVPVLVSGVGAGNVVRSAADANRYVTPDLGTGLRRLNFHCMCPLYWYKRRGGVIHQKMKKLMRRFDWYYSRLSR